MTREEAIERLNIHKSTSVFVDSIAEAIDMAIEALQAEQKYVADLVEETVNELLDSGDWRVAISNKHKSAEDIKKKQIEVGAVADGIVGYETIKKSAERCKTSQNLAKPNKALKGSDIISRADALEQMAQAECGLHYDDCEADNCSCSYIQRILDMPSADAVHGEWVEKEVMVDEDTNITEWQSARCSVCGKYHTTPFMYYFDDFNFCPNCGARMKGGEDE